MQRKYVHKRTSKRKMDPNKWIMGPDPLTREKYYAWLRHRCQARFRKEAYELSFDDWQKLWSDEDFVRRGRKADSLCLSRIDPKDSWSLDNCAIVTRNSHLKRNAEFRNNE